MPQLVQGNLRGRVLVNILDDMRVLLQRVTGARVTVKGEMVGEIGPGLLLLLGIAQADTEADADYLADKILELRVFDDQSGKMNLSVKNVGGALLIVSQFTLYGDCRRGRRPSFDQAAQPDVAKRLYEYFISKVRLSNLTVATGQFQASMKVSLENDGPVTILCESVTIRGD